LYRALELARRLGTETVATAAALLLLAAVLFPRSAYFNARPARFDSKLIDERAFYAETNTLLNYGTTRSVRDHPFSREGLAVRKQARAAGTRITWATALVGMFGFHAGPDVIVIDRIGLADPLLARLPMEDRSRFPKPGHFVRAVPPGYEEARRTGSLDALPPPLAGYYEPLRLIVSGPLLSPERLRTIVLFNFGRYDRFRDDYLRTRSGS
jgi:arabinofuranosyltransferase